MMNGVGPSGSTQPTRFAPDDPLLDEKAAAEYLGGSRPISTRTLQRWRVTGAGPAVVRVGNAVRYRKSALDAFLAAGEGEAA